MSYFEQFKEHIEYTFNGFCKTVLYHEALNAYRDLQRKQRHEISLEYIITETIFEPSAMDEYFQAVYKSTEFQVRGQTVVIDDERLAVALSKLSTQRREIVLLYYFCGYMDKAISELFYYYKKLIELRKKYNIFVDGRFELILQNDPNIFSYIRESSKEKLLIVANFYETEIPYKMPEECWNRGKMLIHNYNDVTKFVLRPYEAMMIYLSK